MATVPLSGTNIRFISGVPFSNDYKHTRWFDTQTQQATYFNGKYVVHEMLKANFQRIEGRTFVSVNKSIDKLWGTNYLFFRNLDYNNKYFYAFVTKLEYVNKEVTNVHFEVDVFQTWKFDMNFKPSFIVREHCKLWNTDGTPVLNTVDEGLNYGTDYVTVGMEKVVPFKGIFFLVIVAKRTMHGGTEDIKQIKPTLNGLPQPLSYYIHPFTLFGESPKVEMDGMPNIKIDSVTDVLKSLYKQDDALNNIAALYITEYPGINAEFTEADGFKITSEYFEHALIQDSEDSFNTLYLKKQMAYIPKTIALGNKYDDYVNVTESKLLMYPYTNLILDDFKGHRITLKNEYVMNNNLNLVVRGAMGTGRQVSYHIEDYLKGKLESVPELLAISMENALVSNTPNDVPIVTDMLGAYLQGNKNAIAVQTSQINANSIMDVIGGGIGVLGSVGSGNGSVAGAAHEGMNMIRGTANGVLNLQAIEAKQQDIDNTPPSIQSMGSNTSFDFGNNYAGVYVIKKQIQHEYRQKLSDFFGMYGYKVNEVKQPNFHTRERWNYVQTEMCNITGNFNNDDLNELKSVFDNGITFWHTDDVGNYALENGVI